MESVNVDKQIHNPNNFVDWSLKNKPAPLNGIEPKNGLSLSGEYRSLTTINEENRTSDNETSSITSDDDSLTSDDSSEPEVVQFASNRNPGPPVNQNRPQSARVTNPAPETSGDVARAKATDRSMLISNFKNDGPKENGLEGSSVSSSSSSSNVVLVKKKEPVVLNNSQTLSDASESNDHKTILAELRKIVKEDDSQQNADGGHSMNGGGGGHSMNGGQDGHSMNDGHSKNGGDGGHSRNNGPSMNGGSKDVPSDKIVNNRQLGVASEASKINQLTSPSKNNDGRIIDIEKQITDQHQKSPSEQETPNVDHHKPPMRNVDGEIFDNMAPQQKTPSQQQTPNVDHQGPPTRNITGEISQPHTRSVDQRGPRTETIGAEISQLDMVPYQESPSHKRDGESGSRPRNDHSKITSKTDREVIPVQNNGEVNQNDTEKKYEPNVANEQFVVESENFTEVTKLRKESFENIEKKLVELVKSATDQTEEIQRIKNVNESLKTKFDELERTSSHHQQIESQMSRKNEDLEKHLLGVLKSQEMMYEMKEKMNVVTATNEKLTKDYEEAVKALEAVDKLFNQKDELVQKWKESTEESRRLIELLKRHNAEVADLETVDKLKDEIADLKNKLSKTENTVEFNETKNRDVIEQCDIWKKKFEHENERGIKLNYELQEIAKESKLHQKLAAKRGRKNQMLHVELTELKDMLKLAKERIAQSEAKMKELEDKNSNSQEMYNNIIHEKEKQHSALLKTSETSQKELVHRSEVVDNLRQEIVTLKSNIQEIDKEKTIVEEKLSNTQKTLEDALKKQVELTTEIQSVQAELEQCKIEKIDFELYIEEQNVHIQEVEEQCRELQQIVKQFIYKTTKKHKRSRSHGRTRLAQSMPTSYPSLEMYRHVLTPPKPMRRRPYTSPIRRISHYPTALNKTNEDAVVDGIIPPNPPPHGTQPSRPKSTYGNRQLSSSQKSHCYHVEGPTKDFPLRSVRLENLKQESDSGSVSVDQTVMDYVKVGDRVLIEMEVEGNNQNLPGVVKYIGPVYHKNFKTGIYAGLKLDIPIGDTNGTLEGRVYFRCLNKFGKFVKLSHILAIQNQRTQQYTRVLPVSHQ